MDRVVADVLRVTALVVTVALAACGEAETAPPADTAGDAPATEAGNLAPRSYERNFVFAALDGESVFMVPWMIQTDEYSDTVVREAQGWLARGGIWEAFYAERWETPPTRNPARVLPHRSLSFVVREGDAIDGIVFEEGPRSLELVLGEVHATWSGARGEAFEVIAGAAYLSDQRVDGLILDMSRASTADGPPGGDWALLLSGDSARFFFAADSEYGGDAEPIYRGWADLEDRELQWPAVRVDWESTQAFPPARRDVPVAWRVWSDDGTLEGELEAVSAEIQPGSGPGPLLPVLALFEVAGTVATDEGNFPVRGLLVHERR